jgi:hypothetical protein
MGVAQLVRLTDQYSKVRKANRAQFGGTKSFRQGVVNV